MRTHTLASFLLVAVLVMPVAVFAGVLDDEYVSEDSSPHSQDTVTASGSASSGSGTSASGSATAQPSVNTRVAGCDNATYQRALAGDREAQRRCTPCGTVTYQDGNGKTVTCAKNEGCSVPKCSTEQMQKAIGQTGSTGGTTGEPDPIEYSDGTQNVGDGYQGIQNAFSQPSDSYGTAELLSGQMQTNSVQDVLGAGWLPEYGIGNSYPVSTTYTGPIQSNFLGGLYTPNAPALSTPSYSFSYSPFGTGGNSFMPEVSFGSPNSFGSFGSPFSNNIMVPGGGFIDVSSVTFQPISGLSYGNSFGTNSGMFGTMSSYYSPTLGSNLSTNPFLDVGLAQTPVLSSGNSLFSNLLNPTPSGYAQGFVQGGLINTSPYSHFVQADGTPGSFTPVEVRTVSPSELPQSIIDTALSPTPIADLQNALQGGGSSVIQQLRAALGDAAPTPTVVRTFSITPVSMSDVVSAALAGNFAHASELLSTAVYQATSNISQRVAQALGEVAPGITEGTITGASNVQLPETAPIPTPRPNDSGMQPTAASPDAPGTTEQPGTQFPDQPQQPQQTQQQDGGQTQQQPQQQQPQQPQMPQGGGGQGGQPQITQGPESTISPEAPRVVQFSCNPAAVLESGIVSVVWGCGGGAQTSIGTGFESSGSLSGSIQTTISTTTNLSIACTGASGTTPATRSCKVRSVVPKLVMVAVPSEIAEHGSVNIAWVTKETSGCTLYGPQGAIKNGATGVAKVEDLTASSQFSLVCSAEGTSELVRQNIDVMVEGSESVTPASVSNEPSATPETYSYQEGDATDNAGSDTTQNNSGTFTATDENGNTVSLCDPSAGITKFTACLLSSF